MNDSSVGSSNDGCSNSNGCFDLQNSSLNSDDDSLGNLLDSQFLKSDSESDK